MLQIKTGLVQIDLQLQYLQEKNTHVLFLIMDLQVVGETMAMANLEMELLLIEIHLLKHLV